MARVDYFNDPAAPAANSIVPSVTAVVRNDAGELLLVHKTDNNLWALPGGGVDPGESVSMAVVREVKEETSRLEMRSTFCALSARPKPNCTAMNKLVRNNRSRRKFNFIWGPSGIEQANFDRFVWLLRIHDDRLGWINIH